MGGHRHGDPESAQKFPHRRHGELSRRLGGDGPDGGGWRADNLAPDQISARLFPQKRGDAMRILAAIGLLALLPPAASAQQPAGVPHPGTEAPSCAPSMGLNFVCGLDQPEDLLQIGVSKWVIASGMGEHGGIFLIDAEAKKAQRFFTGAAKPDLTMYPDCTAAPPSFNSHGIALRPAKTAGTYTLYSVTHQPFESIQVFSVDARGAAPAISWTGCVKLPADFKTNSVTAKSDGTILANVQMHGKQLDFISGNITGGVWA